MKEIRFPGTDLDGSCLLLFRRGVYHCPSLCPNSPVAQQCKRLCTHEAILAAMRGMYGEPSPAPAPEPETPKRPVVPGEQMELFR